MITLVCTKCGTTLNVDNGFAGGVCRCNRCGTIQTVPKLGQSNDGGEAIFERAKRGSSNRDLEALGDIVTSSGLAGSGVLRQSRRPADAGVPEATRRRGALVAILCGAGVAIGVSVWLVASRSGVSNPANTPNANTDSNNSDASSTPAVAPSAPSLKISGPSFGPIPLSTTGTVVYLVDRGDATRAYTAALQRAVAKSVGSLGSARKFQVRYWTADGESPEFPLAPADANAANVGRLITWMNDVPGGRSTDAGASLDSALAVKPTEIVILTGKAWQLDDSFANEAIVKLSSGGVRVHAIALGGSAGSDALARVTAKTGGTFLEMDETALTLVGGK